MIELLRSDNSTLDISYTASANVSTLFYNVEDLDTSASVQIGISTLVGASSVFTTTLTENSTSYDRNIKITFTPVSTASYTDIRYYSLIRPYVSPSRIVELADIPATASGNTALLTKMEKKARLVIDTFIGHGFYKKFKPLEVYGNNTDILFLNEEIIRIDEIYEDDLLVYQTGNETYQLDYPIEISTSGNRIKIVNTSEKNTETLEYPKFSVFHYDGVFKKNYMYKLVGVFGYEYVPSNVELATALLVEDYLCNDSSIRNKNIVELSNDSYDIKFAADFATGTGNLIVDSLLAEYRQPRFMVI